MASDGQNQIRFSFYARSKSVKIDAMGIRLLLLLVFIFYPDVARSQQLRVLTYNVLYGFNHGKAVETGAKWIAGRKPDIVALQELNNFKQEDLAKLAKTWKHDHAIILKEKEFPVALTANSEIEVIEKRLAGMWHGYLHCKVRGRHIFVVHLSPSQHDFRAKEAALLCAKAKPLLEAGEPVLFLGDFNCNSPLDRQWLEARPRPEVATDAKTAKSQAQNNDPEFAVMSQFLALGLVDLVHAKQPAKELERGTFATRLLPKYRSAEQRKDTTWRIDYILADSATAKGCQRADILRDEEMDLISDHYPVEAILNQ